MRSTAAPTERDVAATVVAVVTATDERTESDLASVHLCEPLLAFAGVSSEFYAVANSIRRTSREAAAVVALMALCHSVETALRRASEVTPSVAILMNAALHALDAAAADLYETAGAPCSPAPSPAEAARLRKAGWTFLEGYVAELQGHDVGEQVVEALSLLELQPGASSDELRRAYHAKAKQWHPDLRGEDASGSATQRMSELNAAFALLKDEGTTPPPGARANPSRPSGGDSGGPDEAPSTPHRPSSPPSSGPPRRRRRDDECEWCGHAPARSLTFRQVTGMIFVRRWANLTQTLCRPCGLAVGADAQSRTMMTGWWGILSALHNVFAVIANAANLLKARALGRPSVPTDDVATPSSMPMPPPEPLLKRPGTWVGGAVIGLACIVGLGSLDTSAPSTPPAPTSDTSGSVDDSTSARREDPRDLVGECLSFDSAGYLDDIVPCSTPGAIEVVDVVPDPRDCPSWSPSYLEATTADVGYYDTVCLDG